MLHILHGPDSFSRAEAYAALIRTLDRDGMLSANTTTLEAKSLTFEHLQMVCDAMPFLADARLVVVDGLLGRLGGRAGRRRAGAPATVSLPEEWRAFPEYAPKMPPTTTLVLRDAELPEGHALLNALAEHGRVRAFPKLPPRAIEGWIVKRAQALKVTIEPEAVRLLAESTPRETGEDGQWHALWTISNDLEKLALHAGDQPVSAADVELLVASAAESNVFQYVDAVLEQRGEEALRRLEALLFAGQPPPVLLTMLTRGYRQLLLYQELAAAGERPESIMRQIGVRHPRLLENLRRQAARYQPARLAAIYQRILAADRASKRGQTDETAALELLTADLSALEAVL